MRTDCYYNTQTGEVDTDLYSLVGSPYKFKYATADDEFKFKYGKSDFVIIADGVRTLIALGHCEQDDDGELTDFEAHS